MLKTKVVKYQVFMAENEIENTVLNVSDIKITFKVFQVLIKKFNKPIFRRLA